MGFFNLDMSIGRKPTAWMAQGPLVQPNNAVGTTFVWYDNTFNQDPNLKYPTMALELGSVWFEEDTGGYNIMNGFQYVQLTATTAAGQLVTLDTNPFGLTATGDVVIAAGSDTTKVQLTTLTIATNAAVGALLYLENAGTNPQMRVVKANTANGATPDRTFYVSLRDPNNTGNIQDADVLPYTPTNAGKAFLFNPFARLICTAALTPMGVALGATTYTVNPYSVVQVTGVAMVQPSATAFTLGVQAKAVAAGQAALATSTYAINQGINMVSFYQGTPTAGSMIPIAVNFLGTI